MPGDRHDSINRQIGIGSNVEGTRPHPIGSGAGKAGPCRAAHRERDANPQPNVVTRGAFLPRSICRSWLACAAD
jgi:hypothetical protein